MFQHVVRTAEVWQAGGGSTLNRPPYPTANMHANATLTPLTRAKMIAHQAEPDGDQRTIHARLEQLHCCGMSLMPVAA
jgi:hypothetical protein